MTTLQQHNRNMIESFFSHPIEKAIMVVQHAIDNNKCSVEIGNAQIAALKSL